jgi:hypothetical protein
MLKSVEHRIKTLPGLNGHLSSEGCPDYGTEDKEQSAQGLDRS